MSRAGRQADVAVYAPLAGPLYARDPGPSGGAERQAAFIARSLAASGLRVRVVVGGDDLCATRDGVEVVPLRGAYGTGGLGRRRAALAALAAADADLLIQRSAGFETGLVAVYARATRRRFVFSSSSTIGFTLDPSVLRLTDDDLGRRSVRLQYLVGLRLAHAVVTQTEEQRELARRHRHVQTRVIPSFFEPAAQAAGPREAFLWIGQASPFKDPGSYIELAERVPEARFRMVFAERGKWASLAGEIRARAARLPNLELLPEADRGALDRLYERAVAVVSTSLLEGFPNVFLEGWARGLPALSLRVDPDGVIKRFELGASGDGSLDRLSAEARGLWQARDAIDGTRYRDYVARAHAPAAIGAEWAALVHELLGR